MIDDDIGKEDLVSIFEPFGRIVFLDLKFEGSTGTARIGYDSEASMREVIRLFNGVNLLGQQVSVMG